MPEEEKVPPQYRVLSGTSFSVLQVQRIRSTRPTSKQTCLFRSGKSESRALRLFCQWEGKSGRGRSRRVN